MSSFFFNDTAATEIYTLSLHDALPISRLIGHGQRDDQTDLVDEDQPIEARQIDAEAERRADRHQDPEEQERSEEHTSELQSQSNLVCRLLLEKKKNKAADHRATIQQHR